MNTKDKLKATAENVAREVGSRWREDLAEDWELDLDDVGIGPVGQHRDSGVLDVSNFATILEDLQSVDDRVTEIRFGHWAVGWVEEIAVPLDNPAVIERVSSWVDALENYPVADEEDYSRRECEDAIETLEWAYGVSAEDAPTVFTWLFDNYSYSSGEDYRQDAVNEALEALGLLEDA
jgi:hypothetical protein